jgi:RNA polymerase sigma factor (sigma-70 family)
MYSFVLVLISPQEDHKMPYSDFFADPPPEDHDANFVRLHEQYKSLINRIVNKYRKDYWRHLGRITDEEELYQIASAALWIADRQFDESFCQGKNRDHVFQAFAKKVVEGRVSDHLRKWSKQNGHELLAHEDFQFVIPAPPGTYEQIRKDMEALLSKYSPRLSPKERTFIKLYVIEGRSIKEIAACQGVAANTVRTWKKRVRIKVKFLKKELNGEK